MLSERVPCLIVEGSILTAGMCVDYYCSPFSSIPPARTECSKECTQVLEKDGSALRRELTGCNMYPMFGKFLILTGNDTSRGCLVPVLYPSYSFQMRNQARAIDKFYLTLRYPQLGMI